MNKERKKLRFEVFLERYFSNFHRILLLNLIFFIPSVAAFGIVHLLNTLFFSAPNVLIYLLGIIPVFPFYSGVVTVVRNIARGDENVKVVPVYFKSLKENFLTFLLHGVVIYVAAVLSYLSISMYVGALKLSWLFYVLLFICIVIVIFVFFTTFYIPLMSVSFDLKLKFIYKNSFLMSFGEFKNNFFATFALAVILALFFTVTIFCNSVAMLVSVIIGFYLLILPGTCSFAVVFFIYDGMYDLITSKEAKIKELDERIANDGKPIVHKPEEEDFSDIDVSLLKNPDDYVFHNGKMIKQSVVLDRIQKQKEGKMNE